MNSFLSRSLRIVAPLALIGLLYLPSHSLQRPTEAGLRVAPQQSVTIGGIVNLIDVKAGVFTVRVKADLILSGGAIFQGGDEKIIAVSFTKETQFLNETGAKADAKELKAGEEKEGTKGGASVVVVTGKLSGERIAATQVVLRTSCDLYICPRRENHANCGATTCTCPGH